MPQIKEEYEYLEFVKVKSKIFTVTYDLNFKGLIKQFKIKDKELNEYWEIGLLGIKIIITEWQLKFLELKVKIYERYLNARK